MAKEYSTNPASATTMAMARIAIVAAGSLAVGKGWVNPEDVDGIATAVVTFGAAGWGLYKTFKRQKKIKNAEEVIGPLRER